MAATPANSINESGASGLCNFDGTATFSTTALVNHSVVIGASANTVTNVAPSATSGIPLVSNGSGSDPSFTTAVVAGGGTGDTSFTAFSVICGGTTSTAALQNVSGVGTSGQVLTSNGAGALPTWQAGGGGGTSPSTAVSLYEEFICDGGNGYAGITASASWLVANYAWQYIISTTTGVAWANTTTTNANAHPGAVTNGAITTTNGSAFLTLGGANGTGITIGGGAITINWIFNIVTLSNSTNRYQLSVGLSQNNGLSNAFYFQYQDSVNSGNWVINSIAATVSTSTNTSTAVATGWHNAQITINAAGTSATFTLDGVSLGTISSGLPSVGLKPVFLAVWKAGTVAANTFQVDAMWLNQTLTSAR